MRQRRRGATIEPGQAGPRKKAKNGRSEAAHRPQERLTMNTPQRPDIDALRQVLLARQRELRAEVSAARAEAPDADDGEGAEVGDQKDQAAAWQQAEVSDAEMQRDLDELAQVEQALHRLEEGGYGECADCGAAIPLARLKAQPSALRCAACQSAVERRH
jgi:DnaK suppressor protein